MKVKKATIKLLRKSSHIAMNKRMARCHTFQREDVQSLEKLPKESMDLELSIH
jgi:hypothetical protein